MQEMLLQINILTMASERTVPSLGNLTHSFLVNVKFFISSLRYPRNGQNKRKRNQIFDNSRSEKWLTLQSYRFSSDLGEYIIKCILLFLSNHLSYQCQLGLKLENKSPGSQNNLNLIKCSGLSLRPLEVWPWLKFLVFSQFGLELSSP